MKLEKPKKVIFLAGILGIFALIDIFVGVYDILYRISVAGISGKVFGILLLSLGLPLLGSVFGIWEKKKWGYLVAMIVILGDMSITGIFFWKLLQYSILLDIVVDVCLLGGIWYVGKEEGVLSFHFLQ